jgi:hypothetical protein
MHLRNIMLNQSFRDNTFHTSYYRGISVNHTKSEICHTYRYFILKCRGISEISYRYYCKSELTLRSYSISGYKIACISWCSSLGTTDCCPRRLGGEISNYSGFLTSPPTPSFFLYPSHSLSPCLLGECTRGTVGRGISSMDVHRPYDLLSPVIKTPWA